MNIFHRLMHRLFGVDYVLLETCNDLIVRRVRRGIGDVRWIKLFGKPSFLDKDGTFSKAPIYMYRWTPLTWDQSRNVVNLREINRGETNG